MSVLHEHKLAFDDRNLFLLVTLGLVSICRGFSDLLLTCGAAPEDLASDPGESHVVLDAAMGLASVSRTLAAQLGDVALRVGSSATAAPVQPDAPDDLRSLLV